jgi:hypothetical protein
VINSSFYADNKADIPRLRSITAFGSNGGLCRAEITFLARRRADFSDLRSSREERTGAHSREFTQLYRTEPNLMSAMLDLPREKFLLREQAPVAYYDRDIEVGEHNCRLHASNPTSGSLGF